MNKSRKRNKQTKFGKLFEIYLNGKVWLSGKLDCVIKLLNKELLISLLAVIISLNANRIAEESNKFSRQANEFAYEANSLYKEELTLTHRPYLWVENFAYLNKYDQSVNEIGTVSFIVLNSPAKIVSSEMIYEVINDKETIEIVRFSPQNGVLYPSDKIQYTSFIGVTEREKLLNYIKNGFEAYRTCYVEYQMLSKDRKFSYRAKWRFNKNNDNWELSEAPSAS